MITVKEYAARLGVTEEKARKLARNFPGAEKRQPEGKTYFAWYLPDGAGLQPEEKTAAPFQLSPPESETNPGGEPLSLNPEPDPDPLTHGPITKPKAWPWVLLLILAIMAGLFLPRLRMRPDCRGLLPGFLT